MSIKSESKLSGAIGKSHRSKDFSYKGGSSRAGVRDSFRTADEGGSEYDDAFFQDAKDDETQMGLAESREP